MHRGMGRPLAPLHWSVSATCACSTRQASGPARGLHAIAHMRVARKLDPYMRLALLHRTSDARRAGGGCAGKCALPARMRDASAVMLTDLCAASALDLALASHAPSPVERTR